MKKKTFNELCMEGKPIIRHCRNCKYGMERWSYGTYCCRVKYKTIEHGRMTALFCRYFKKIKGEK